MLWSGRQDDRRRSVAISLASNPISRAMGTSFVFARSLKFASEGIS